MTLKECYEEFDGDYLGFTKRMMGERLAVRFSLRFLEDKTYEQLADSMVLENIDEAFRAAHTLKGICQNLGFGRLEVSCSEVTEALRAGDMETAKGLFVRVRDDYEQVIAAISRFQRERQSL